MPELPEVETVKTAIDNAVRGAKILRIEVRNQNFKERIPEDFADKLCGAKIESVERIAKYMVLKLSNGFSIIWHLGMSGRFRIYDKVQDTLEKHDHVIIETSEGVIVYNDARRFGVVTYCKIEELGKHRLLDKAGLDPFDERLEARYLFEKFEGMRSPIKVALLDQRIINGIGNIYASEILFEANILPTKFAGEMKIKDCEKIIFATRKVLTKAIEAGGSTLKDYQKPDGSLGYFQNLHCVYNKTGQQCCNCTCDIKKTGGVKKIVQAGRSTFYCPVKQK